MNKEEIEKVINEVKNTLDALKKDKICMLEELPQDINKIMEALIVAKEKIDKFETEYIRHYDEAYRRMRDKRIELREKIKALTADVRIDIPAVVKIDQWIQLADKLGRLTDIQFDRVLKLAEVMKECKA